jgi:hypothetical protein
LLYPANTAKEIKMRLPGTFNLNGKYDLPTAELLLRYAELKQKRREAKLNENADTTKLQAPDTDTKASRPKEKASESKKLDTKADEKKIDDLPAAADFTEAQDKALIELKLKSKSWKEIANEIGKDVGKIKQRFNQIKPNDFDVQMTEAKNKAAEERKGGNDGDAHGGETQGKQKGGKGKDHAKRDDGPREAQDEISDAGTWATPDENWSPTDVCIDSISLSFCMTLLTISAII